MKTRLVASIGQAGATRLAEAFLNDTLRAVRALELPVWLALDETVGELPQPDGVRIVDQGGGDLGERMQRVLGAALQVAPWTVALGTDSPNLPFELLCGAIQALTRESTLDVVLGPSEDGGYWLLGARRLPPGALARVRYGGAHSLLDTERRLSELGLEHRRVGVWYDVDTPADLEQLVRDLALPESIAAPDTRAVLIELGLLAR